MLSPHSKLSVKIKKTIGWCVLLFFVITSSITAQSNIYSEAPIKFENDEKMSTQITVNFKVPAFNLSKGKKKAEITNIQPRYGKIKKYFNELKKKYGKIELIKHVPDAVWGDVWRKNIITGKTFKKHERSQLFTIKFEKYVPIDEIINELQKMEEVDYVHQPIEVIEYVDPNDSQYNNQYNVQKVNAPDAWNLTKGDDGVIVGILEGRGVKTTHPDLSAKIASGGDVAYEATHGTMVAGVAGASTNNGTGIASLGWNTKLMSLKWDLLNQEQSLTDKIEQAINNSIPVINCSFGTIETIQSFECQTSPTKDCYIVQPKHYPSFASAISDAINAGIIVVAASGNRSLNLGGDGFAGCNTNCDPFPYVPYPASYSGVIAVSATDENDVFAGNKPYNTGSFIDFSAPGIDILTSSYDEATQANIYVTASGTSFASPLVAALATLVKSINPSINSSQFEQILINSSIDLGTTGKDNYYGNGRVDAYEALKYTIENFGGTLSGNIKFIDDITLASGKTLTIEAGANIDLASNVDLKINGTLVINGTSSNKVYITGVNKSGGIQFKQGSSGSINYAVIDNVYWGASIDKSTPTIQNTEIKNSHYGIIISNNNFVTGEVTLSNNNINNCTYKGLSFTTSGGYVNSNTITYVSNGSSTGMGIYMTYGACPQIGNGGANTINNNDIGLYTYNSINLTLATGNSFTNNFPYHIKSENNCNITAYNSFSPTYSSRFCATTGSTIYTNYGTFTTCFGGGGGAVANSFNEDKLTKSTSSGNSKVEELLKLWSDHSKGETASSFTSILDNIITEGKPDETTALAEFILAGYDKNNKVAKFKDIAKKYDSYKVAGIIYYDLFMEALLNDDLKEADKQLRSLKKNSPYSELTADAGRFFEAFSKESITENLLSKNMTEENSSLLPEGFSLSQNYPNPFNPETVISYNLPEAGLVTLKVYDILGNEIVTLVNETKQEGIHKITFDASNLPSGTYLYRLISGKFSETKKMILLR